MRVLYELSFPVFIFILPVMLQFIVLVFPIFFDRLMIIDTKKMNIKKIQCFGSIMVLVITLLVSVPIIKDYRCITENYYQGDYLEIEGYVEKFSLLNSAKNQQEKFQINGVAFSYGFAGNMNFIGYQKVNGEVVEEGQYLKVKYIPHKNTNVIVSIEERQKDTLPNTLF